MLQRLPLCQVRVGVLAIWRLFSKTRFSMEYHYFFLFCIFVTINKIINRYPV